MFRKSPTLFSGTAEENLRFGREDADEETIAAAIKDAQAEFIYQRPRDFNRT